MNRPVFPPVPFFAALAALAAYASAFLLLRMADYGPVISWDAAHYISIARNLLHGSGYVAANGDPASAWAPLWPILLAAIGALASVDPRDAAGPLNAVSLGLCVFVAGAWMRRNLDSRFLVVWGCLVVALSPSLTLHSTRALTETMFVLFATLALVCLDRRLAEGGRPWLLWAAVFTGLAWSTRYVGVVVAVAAIAALALRRGVPAPDKAKEIVLFSLISAAPVGAWAMRNLLVTGSFFAPPQPVDLAWWEVVEGILKSTGALLVDPQSGSGFRKTFGGLALLSLAAALAVGVARTKAQGERCDSWRSLRLFGGFVVLFVCFYAWTVFNGNTWHGAQARHLLPVYIPLLFAGLLAADRFLARERKRPPAPGAGKTSWIGGGGYEAQSVAGGRVVALGGMERAGAFDRSAEREWSARGISFRLSRFRSHALAAR